MNYELYFNHKESGKEISSTLQLNNYVLLDRSNSKWNFVVRFPEAGVYKLQIIGGRGYETELCAFRIDCDQPQVDCKPLPFNPGKIGYGPSIDTELAGIKAVTHMEGVVKMFVRKRTEFTFNLTRQVTVKTKLIHSTISSTELEQYCVQIQQNRLLNVMVTMPEGGEFALAMYAQQANTGDFQNVCNYLLTSNERNKRHRDWEVNTPIGIFFSYSYASTNYVL